MPVDIQHLPLSMQRRPEIRALTLTVYRDGSNFKVPGKSRIYDVERVGINTLRCTCIAAERGKMCAHVHAVRRYIGAKPKDNHQVNDLTEALPRTGGSWKKTELHLTNGEHKGYFIGLSDPILEESNFACDPCKGQRTINGAECRSCSGTGKKSGKKVAIRFQMAPDRIEEEWVNFKLSPPSKSKDGKPLSASMLWRRLRVLAGTDDPVQINEWYKSLPKPCRVPIKLLIIDDDHGSPTIGQLSPIKLKEGTPAVAATPPPPEYEFPEHTTENDHADDDDSLPF